MKPRIFLTRRWPDAVEAHLQTRYDVEIRNPDLPMSADELRLAMGDFDALCPTVTDVVDKDVLSATPRRVRFIGNYGVGYQHIDVDACRALGIHVSNTPDILTDATANLAIALMLMVSRRAGEGERLVRAGRWSGWTPTQLRGFELRGKTLGLLGFGRIGRAVASKASQAFGVKIAYHARSRHDGDVTADVLHVEDLDRLVSESDILSIHCPGGAATRHLIDWRRLGLMKRGAILINTARGSIVDEAALAARLAEGSIAGAGLDVYEDEPLVHPQLMGLENVVLLPHLGSATEETRTAMGMRVAENLDAFFSGLEPPDAVV